jgi:uncharacterized Zn finger protein
VSDHSEQQTVIPITIWFNLKKLNEVEGKEKYHVEVTNKSATLEDWDTEIEINSSWETIRENMSISTQGCVGSYEVKKPKSWFDE